MSNHPNRAQIYVPVRLLDELAGALDLALSRLEWVGPTNKLTQELQAHGRKLVSEARSRLNELGNT